MKTSRYILSCCLLAATALTTGCNDFLEEDNKSNISAENYYVDETGFTSLVNACYHTLRTVWGEQPWLFCSGTDIFDRGETYQVGGDYQNRDIYGSELNEYATLDAQNGFVLTLYKNLYSSIQTCNTAIARSVNISGMKQTAIDEYLAEVRFIRAQYYFTLVEQFGDVPLVTDEITGAVTHFDRSSEEDVYKFIIDELNTAISNLPETQSQFGRVTKGAAKHLLSLVYLTRGYKSFAAATDFQQAATLADEVINGKTYSLQTTFAEVFDENNEKNSEIIFSVQYDQSIGSNAGCHAQNALFGFAIQDLVAGGFEYGNTMYAVKTSEFEPNQFLYSLYNTDIDSRYDATFRSEYPASCSDASIGITAGELRIFFPYYDHPMSATDSAAFVKEHPHCIIVNPNRWNANIEKVGGSGLFPMIWKFYQSNTQWLGEGTRDIYLYRLADTYLNAAEAYFKMGNKAQAAAYINKLRERAAKPNCVQKMDISESDVTEDFLLDERARETCGEYKRWNDLKRTGRLDRALLHNVLCKRANALKDYHYLRPIPQSVIDEDSGDFPQNTGY